MEKFSVLMSVYFKEKPEYLKQSIDSILDQTLTPNEIVLVKDGPLGDDLDQVIDDLVSSNKEMFIIVKSEKNIGLGLALNLGLEACKNDLIARMDSDDIAERTRFEQQILYFRKHPEIDVLGGDITEFISDVTRPTSRRTVPTQEKEIEKFIKIRCPFNHMSVMFRKDSVLKSGGYIDLFWNEDYFLWIRMFELNYHFGNTGTSLVNVRVGKDMFRRRGGLHYFRSELTLQNYMFKRGMINVFRYFTNIASRFLIQVILPNEVRGWLILSLMRERYI